MPRFPTISSSTAELGGAVYSSSVKRLAAYKGETYPLHIGDTWLEPAEGCRMEDLSVAQFPGMHRYAPPRGLDTLVECIIDRTHDRCSAATERDNVLVTAGATGGLSAVLGALLEPGDEVLIPAPFWPLIAGIVRRLHCRAVMIPIDPQASAAAALELISAHRSSRTVALYLSTPNNPTGHIMPAAWQEAFVEWARREDLWLIADDAYEEYNYTGQHTYLRDLAPERTFSVYTFSKALGMAGNRCGYVLGPAEAMRAVCKISTHAFFCAPRAAQLAAVRALQGNGDQWVAEARAQYVRLGRLAATRLGVAEPEGGTFLFMDIADRLDDRGLMGFLEDCAGRGLLLAPGPSFGPYPTHIRVCFTAVPPDIFSRGLAVLAEMLGSDPVGSAQDDV
jgi:aspartate/methionine/tyrosine aminotransferase